jgi:spermidine synthase
MGKINIPDGQIGEYKVEKFIVDRVDFHSLLHGREVPMGKTFTRLMRGKTVVMSDTPAECDDQAYFIRIASGNVLIAGLGIGYVLQEVAKKDNVNHVTVIEISSEIIQLVWSHYQKRFGDKIELINADVFEWKPPRDIKYNYAWYDIWDDICMDNYEGMKKLHRKFAKRVINYQGSWSKDYLKSML